MWKARLSAQGNFARGARPLARGVLVSSRTVSELPAFGGLLPIHPLRCPLSCLGLYRGVCGGSFGREAPPLHDLGFNDDWNDDGGGDAFGRVEGFSSQRHPARA